MIYGFVILNMLGVSGRSLNFPSNTRSFLRVWALLSQRCVMEIDMRVFAEWRGAVLAAIFELRASSDVIGK